MVDYHREEVARELVSYIEKYHPEVLFMVRSDDTSENRKMGKRPGFPDVLVLEIRGRYIGLAVWITRKLTDHEIRQRERFARSGHEVEMSDDWDDLRLIFMEYIYFPNLTYSQLDCLKTTAKRLYITIASRDYQDITDIIDFYMIDMYERGKYLPKFCDEDCP